MVDKLYRCPSCGEVLTDEEYDEQLEDGFQGYCYCMYTAYDKDGVVWYPRELVPYEVFVKVKE